MSHFANSVLAGHIVWQVPLAPVRVVPWLVPTAHSQVSCRRCPEAKLDEGTKECIGKNCKPLASTCKSSEDFADWTRTCPRGILQTRRRMAGCRGKRRLLAHSRDKIPAEVYTMHLEERVPGRQKCDGGLSATIYWATLCDVCQWNDKGIWTIMPAMS